MSVMLRWASAVSFLGLIAGCAQQAGDIPITGTPEVTQATFNVEGAPTVEFSVPDMMCPEGCGEATREILAEQEGVKDVKIDFPSKLAVVAVDQEKFNADKALAELIDHGFDNSKLKTSAPQ